jgi:hypothetical protein
MKTPDHCMRQVLALAADALPEGEFPIAATVVLDDEMIAWATISLGPQQGIAQKTEGQGCSQQANARSDGFPRKKGPHRGDEGQ